MGRCPVVRARQDTAKSIRICSFPCLLVGATCVGSSLGCRLVGYRTGLDSCCVGDVLRLSFGDVCSYEACADRARRYDSITVEGQTDVIRDAEIYAQCVVCPNRCSLNCKLQPGPYEGHLIRIQVIPQLLLGVAVAFRLGAWLRCRSQAAKLVLATSEVLTLFPIFSLGLSPNR